MVSKSYYLKITVDLPVVRWRNEYKGQQGAQYFPLKNSVLLLKFQFGLYREFETKKKQIRRMSVFSLCPDL